MSLITELITTKLQTFYQGLIRSMRWSHISGARVTENCNKFANLLTHFCLKFLATVCHWKRLNLPILFFISFGKIGSKILCVLSTCNMIDKQFFFAIFIPLVLFLWHSNSLHSSFISISVSDSKSNSYWIQMLRTKQRYNAQKIRPCHPSIIKEISKFHGREF